MAVAGSGEAGRKQLLARERQRGTTCWRQPGRRWPTECWLLNNSGRQEPLAPQTWHCPSSQPLLYPNELLEELDANASSSSSPKTRTLTAIVKSPPRQLKGPFSGLNSLPCSFHSFSLPLTPIFFHHFHPSIYIIRMTGCFWCIKRTKYMSDLSRFLQGILEWNCAHSRAFPLETSLPPLAGGPNAPLRLFRRTATPGFSRAIPANWTALRLSLMQPDTPHDPCGSSP